MNDALVAQRQPKRRPPACDEGVRDPALAAIPTTAALVPRPRVEHVTRAALARLRPGLSVVALFDSVPALRSRARLGLFLFSSFSSTKASRRRRLAPLDVKKRLELGSERRRSRLVHTRPRRARSRFPAVASSEGGGSTLLEKLPASLR
jgi:hypothetical protein